MGKQSFESAVIDRFEDGGTAVLLVGDEEREQIVPRSSLPPAAAEGTWLRVRFVDGQLVGAVIDETRTAAVRQRVTSKMDLLRSRGRRLGDVSEE